MDKFCELLKTAREGAGFTSAYRFYHTNGGRRHFPFTFVHYTRIEKGVSLPKPEWLECILLALRTLPVDAAARQLLTAYVREMLGGGRSADYILSPLLGQAGGPATDTQGWMKRYNSEHLSPAAFAVMTASPAAYWCAEALFNDTGSWSDSGLAEKLGFKPAEIKKALKELEKAGLAVRTRDSKYKCAQPGKFFSYPGRLEGMGESLDKVKEYWSKTHKRDFFERLWIGRAKEGDMANYRFSLAQAIDAANNYTTHSGPGETGFFQIETRIKRLKDF